MLSENIQTMSIFIVKENGKIALKNVKQPIKQSSIKLCKMMIKNKNNVFGNVIIDLIEDIKYIGNNSKMIF